ncbi:hypothetical protein RRG08_044700 [Elysia crispata]|uniref:Uncharacterized protein n=1 Tax=Elysia crispata TaxID=231223 RepID=A0AAE0ZYT8_9GAST|nr:hypothetical protein RRG08_044700 [Elysia crispata]
MLKCLIPHLRNLRNGHQQLSPRCLVLDPATSKSVHQGQRGGDTSSSCSRDLADVMATQTLENFPKNPAVGISPLNLLRMTQTHPPSSQQLEATNVSQLSQPDGFNFQESQLID